MSTHEIECKVRELRELRRMAEELNGEMEALQDEIKKHMTAQGVEELSGTDYKVTWKAVKSSRFDTKAFKLAYGNLFAEYSHETMTRRFCLA